MRHKIWKKDDYFEISDTRIDMDPSVVFLPYRTLLIPNFDFNTKPIGRVTEIQLVDGEITGEPSFFAPHHQDGFFEEILNKVRLGGYYTDVIYSDDRLRVLGCNLKVVCILPIAAFPNPN